MGSDGGVGGTAPPWRSFNSRSRMGSDTKALASSSAAVVSIHAPAWGATFPTCACARAHVFQFTLPHGERRGERAHGLPFLAFQFTLPHGERHEGDVCLVGVDSFNSRSRMGSDRRSRATPGLVPEFQFTLPHGERPGALGASEKSHEVSIHAPAWGATGLDPATLDRWRVSIHAPAWGATWPGRPQSARPWFQFTLPHGERRENETFCEMGQSFNSRSRMGSDSTSRRNPPTP